MNQDQLAPSTGHPVAINKGFGTGKGTTAKIKAVFTDFNIELNSEEIAIRVEVPSRQISKRLAELVKSGFLHKFTDMGRNTYQRAISI